MRIASVADVKAKLSAYLKEGESGPVVITRNGRPVGVLLATQDEDQIERLILGHSPKLRAILDAAHRRIQAGKGLPHDEFWKQVEAEPSETPKPRRTKSKTPNPRKPRGKRP
jgi:prevent-host-death family protein